MNPKHRMLLIVPVLVLLLSLAGLPAFADPVVRDIDPFVDGQCVAGLSHLCPSGELPAPVVSGGGILGGERDVLLTLLDDPVVSLWITGDGRLSYANGPGTRSTALLAWDGPDGNAQVIDYTGLGAVNLDDMCGPGIVDWTLAFDQQFLDRAVEYQVRIYSDAYNYSEWSSGLVQGESCGQSSARSFALSRDDFALAGGSGADLSRVGAITLQIDATQTSAVDLVLGAMRFECPPPTAVDLVSFEAARTPTGVLLEWETATEIDTLGFNLYRAESEGGLKNRLNENLIPSQVPGSPVGAIYQYLDETVSPTNDNYYWLEALDVYGHSTLHGPVHVPAEQAMRYEPDEPIQWIHIPDFDH